MSDAPPHIAASSAASAWAGKKVLVGLSGGIACYKTPSLVSALVQQGAIVRVLMTDAATKFITPLTLQALSGNTVLTSIWQSDDRPDSQHIGLARWCDLVIIAPTTADLIAKLAAGICDDILSLTICALPRSPKATPVLLAPAMNAQMWENPITQRNLHTLQTVSGYHCVGPETGWQACRTAGAGRMSEPQEILVAAQKLLG